MEQRYHSVMSYCVKLMNEGKVPYSPIVYCHEMARLYKLPTDAQFWWKFNETMLLRANVLQVYKLAGWENSVGIRMELDHAEDNWLPIAYINPL